MFFRDKTFRYRNFMELGFRLFIVIKKDLLASFDEKNIEILKKQLHKTFQAHEEFIEDRMVVGIWLKSEEEMKGKGIHFRYHINPNLKKCYLDLNADYYFKNPEYRYPMIVHELTHWHDRAIVHRWHKSHLVSDREEVNLLSMILHSLRIDGLANLRMFYSKANKNELFLKEPHKISMIARDVEVNLDFISYILDFKTRLTNFKKVLIKSEHPKDIIGEWAAAQYKHFYFLGGMMCYFILFRNMIKNNQASEIKIFLDENQEKEINIKKIKNYLHRKELYFRKVPLDIFEYTFKEIKKLKPAEFFITYLEASKVLGLDHDKTLLFDKPEIDIIKKHKQEIDRDMD